MNAMRPYFLLFTFTFLFRLATALPLEHAGYMDASYALHIAENLTRGQGLVENILWNYLDQPTGLPHPSNLYWMPLPSLLIAPLFAIFGATYRVAQVPFIVLSSLLPLVAFHLSRKIFARDDFAWAAGLFTAFSGFYTIYWVSPDNFTPFALTASLCLFAIARGVEEIGRGLTRMDADGIQSASVRASAFAFFRVNFAKQLPTSNLQSPTSKKGIASSYPSTRSTRSRSLLAMKSARYFFLAGILAALSHLSRADGVLLLGVVPIALLFSFRRNAQENAHKALDYGTRNTQSAVRITHHVSRLTLYALLGYLLTMAPWFARNYFAVGAIFPSAGTKTLWLTNYDELFRFTDDLTLERYLAWGAGAIAESKLVAAIRNIFIIAFGDLQLFLVPFALIGWWKLRKHNYYLPFTIYFFLLYFAMTFLFTFPAWRGSLLHSATAFLPFLAVAAPPGIDAAAQWIAWRRSTWDAAQASRFFRAGFAALAIFFSIFLYAQGVFGALVGEASTIPLWNQRDAHYPAIARWLDANARAPFDDAQGDVVMVVDPPSFYNVSHRRAIMIPTDSVDAIFAAAQKYGARYMILEFDHPSPLNDLYHERAAIPGFQRAAAFRDTLGRPVMLYELAR